MAKLPDPRTIRRLYKTLADAPGNLAALTIGRDGSMRAEFVRAEMASEVSRTPAGAATKLVPGTVFPDDETPIDIADLTLNPIDLEDRN